MDAELVHDIQHDKLLNDYRDFLVEGADSYSWDDLAAYYTELAALCQAIHDHDQQQP